MGVSVCRSTALRAKCGRVFASFSPHTMKRSCPSPTGGPSSDQQGAAGNEKKPRNVPVPVASQRSRLRLPDPVVSLANRLRTIYKGCTVELNQGKGYDEESLDLEEVYAKLHVVPREDLSSNVRAADQLGSTAGIEKLAHAFGAAAKKLRPIPLGKIFHVKRSKRRKMRHKSVLALALSCAGGGKTMLFTKKAPYEWAKKRIWRGIDLLFAVELRSAKVRQAETPMQLLDIASYGFEDEGERWVVNEFIHRHPERVCIVLDGLDETKLSECSKFVKNLIAGKRLPGIRLLLTSRHSSDVIKLVQKVPFHRRVEVLGFQKEEVERYVRNVLSSDDADEVLATLTANPQLAAIMQTPFFAVATCKLYRSGVALPDTLGNIFSALILNVIEQQQKEMEEFKEYSDWSSVPKAIQGSVLELGFFAFQMLIRKKIIFTEADLDTFEVSAAARSLGLLVACDKEAMRSNAQWRFSHLAIQESLAARHVASCNLNAADTAWLVEHLGAFTGHLSTFWLLMAAELESKSADALINAILHPQRSSPQGAAGHCVTGAEGHDVTYFLCASRGDITQWAEHLSEILPRDQVERLAIQLLSDHVGLGWPSLAVEARLRPGEVERTVDFMQALLLRWRRLVPTANSNTQLVYNAIDSFAPGLAVRCFTSVPSSETAQVQYEQSSSEPLLPLSESSPEERRQRLLSAYRCFSEHVNSEHSTGAIHSLQPVVKQYGLDFHRVPLTSTDCRAINYVLIHLHQSITKVDLTRCDIGDSGYEHLTTGLELCQNLTYLDLHSNSLSDRHGLHIGAVIISNRSTLQHLRTAANTFTSVGNAHIHQYTHLCTNLRALAIGGQGSTDGPMNLQNITRVLDNCRHLQIVGLSGYMIGDDGLAQLQPLMATLRLGGLALEKTGLTQECAPVMNLILQQQQDSLEWLDLARNALTDSFLRDVHSTLRQCRKLRSVMLHMGDLTSASLPIMAQVLPEWHQIRELVMASNDFRAREEEAEWFVRAIEMCPRLQLLRMPEPKLMNKQLQLDLRRAEARRGDLKVKFVKVAFHDELKEEEREGDGEPEVEVVEESESESECEEESESEDESDY